MIICDSNAYVPFAFSDSLYCIRHQKTREKAPKLCLKKGGGGGSGGEKKYTTFRS